MPAEAGEHLAGLGGKMRNELLQLMVGMHGAHGRNQCLRDARQEELRVIQAREAAGRRHVLCRFAALA